MEHLRLSRNAIKFLHRSHSSWFIIKGELILSCKIDGAESQKQDFSFGHGASLSNPKFSIVSMFSKEVAGFRMGTALTFSLELKRIQLFLNLLSFDQRCLGVGAGMEKLSVGFVFGHFKKTSQSFDERGGCWSSGLK